MRLDESSYPLRAERMSDEPHKDTLHFLNAHLRILDDSPVQPSRRDMPPAAFLLQGIETLEEDTFLLGETVSEVWEIITRVTGTHVEFSLVGQSAQEASTIDIIRNS
jgi:hypothetical protein